MTQAYNYCALPLASYACRPDHSQGRLYQEPESRHRTAFQRDRDRVIHASAFRRLKYKTQVFVADEGDHYRTRLTHTLEVAQIARTLARALMVNEDLAEVVALSHDLGHTPFAHGGEEVLSALMYNFGGFEHNDQSLRVLTLLEDKYPHFQGLNLTWETLEGVVKHNGPIVDKTKDKTKLPFTIKAFQEQMDLKLETYASAEAQVAAISDDIAYNNHDLEDGLRAGFFTLKDLEKLQLTGSVIARLKQQYPSLDQRHFTHEMIRATIGEMVEDVLVESRQRLMQYNPQTPHEIRSLNNRIISFSQDMRQSVDELRRFLFARLYDSANGRVRPMVEIVLKELFERYYEQPQAMPKPWHDKILQSNESNGRARIVCDYIAGMTDRFAVKEHERLFGSKWDLT